jgi:4'-phosphopantetheinyl transferase
MQEACMSDQVDSVQLNILRISTLDNDAVARLWAEASKERKEQAERYARRADALRCLSGEALLRHALRSCGYDETLVPQKGSNGKPYLPLDRFHYNVSHGGDYVVLAFFRREIGVDVEPVKISERRLALANRYFTPAEQTLLQASDDLDAATRFSILWTRKESYVKYTGVGLSQGLQSFSVDVTLPWGAVKDTSGGSTSVRCYTILTEDQHAISICGAFDHVDIEYVAK